MILLQVGQAGLQVGQSLINNLECENKSKNYISYPLNSIDQLCIDTERKVWTKLQKRKSVFPATYIDHGVSGRANNWAFGYFGGGENVKSSGSNGDVEAIMETYRRMVESVYRYDGVLMIHSLAGGTGSGLGSRLLEEIRQEYDKAAIMTASFAPFTSGETAVQSYNSLLSLSVLQEYADFIGFFSNDCLMTCVERVVANRSSSSRMSATSSSTPASAPLLGHASSIQFNALNEYAASCLAGHLLPVSSVSPTLLPNTPSRSTGTMPMLEFHQNRMTSFRPLEFIYNMSPMPLCKYGLFSSSLGGGMMADKKSSLDSWDDILGNMLRNIPVLHHNDPISLRMCLSSHLTLRGVQGNNHHSLWPRLGKLQERWQNKIGHSILEPTIDFSYLYGLDTQSQKRSADTCFNSDLILQHIDPILSKARMLYENRAYLHSYERYINGSGQDTKHVFQDAFESLEKVKLDYSSLASY